MLFTFITRGRTCSRDDVPVSLVLLSATFLVAVGVVWVAGTWLSNTTDILSKRFGLGEALGGLILLAFATNLPEIAITLTAAYNGTIEIAVGNLLGGIATQTVVLVILDYAAAEAPLTCRHTNLVPVLEGILVLVVLAIFTMGAQLPGSYDPLRLDPGALLIAGAWVAGIWIVSKARSAPIWTVNPAPPPSEHHERPPRYSTARAIAIFAAGAALTLIAGGALEVTGDHIAGDIGLSGVVFGATVLAAATALPQLSSGLQAIKLGDYALAVSDVFGGNAVLPVLLFFGGLVLGDAVLANASKTDLYLAAAGALLTAPYLVGLVLHSRRQYRRLGVDSIAVLALYALVIVGLVAVSAG
jgi:cation:H+ antiporter